MSTVKDYSNKDAESQYVGVQSEYSKSIAEQNRLRPKYCEPAWSESMIKNEKQNKQLGP